MGQGLGLAGLHGIGGAACGGAGLGLMGERAEVFLY